MNRIQCLTQHVVPIHTTTTMMESQPCVATGDEVLYRVEDGVAILTLNRPSRGNAYTTRMQIMYFDMLDRANADPKVLAIVVTGAGSMFCVGADKDELSGIESAGGAGNIAKAMKRDTAQVQALEIDKPIIAAINGAVAGLGLVTALMCDVRFAAAGVKFTTAFAKRGLVAEHGISWVLPRVVGMSRALDLLMSSRVVKSDEALAMGMVNFVSPTAKQCVEEAIKYARECGKLCSPAALSEIKRQIYTKPLSPREDYERAVDLMTRSFTHVDFKEGVASLVEKRDPQFKGFAAGFIRNMGKQR